MPWTLDPLPSYKFVILFSELERMKLTQPPTTFLLDVTYFAVFVGGEFVAKLDKIFQVTTS